MPTPTGKQRQKKRPAPAAPASVSLRWPDRLLDAALTLLIGLVPLIFYTHAFNALLAKDIAIGVLLSAMGSAVAIAALAGRQLSWPRTSLNAAVWALLIISLISLLTSDYRYAAVGALLRLGAGALFYFLIISHVRERGQFARLLWVTIVGALLSSIYGVMQKSGLDFVEWESELTRIPGPYGNPTYFASYLVLVLPLTITLAAFPPAESRRPPVRALLAAAAGIMLVCLVWTITVAALVGLALALGIGAVALVHFNAGASRQAGRRRATLIAALVVLAAWSLAWAAAPATYRARMLSLARPKVHADVRRILIWKSALQIFSEKPLLGRGPGTYQIYSRGRYAPVVFRSEVVESSGAIHAHNAFLETLAETGALGGAVLLWLLGTYFWIALKVVRRTSDPFARNAVIALAAGVAAYMVQNLFAVTFFILGCQMFFWLALAITVVAEHQSDARAPRTVTLRLRKPTRLVAAAAILTAVLALWVSLFLVAVAEYHFWRGEAFGDQGMFAEASAELRKAVAINPYCQRAWYQLGAALGKQNRFSEAARALERSAALSPDYLRTQYNLGATYFGLGDYRRAAAAFARALQAEKSALNYRAVSDAYARQGRLDLAIRHAETGIREFPKDIALRQHAARLLLQKGDEQGARRHVECAARLDRNNAETRRLQAVLRRRPGQH